MDAAVVSLFSRSILEEMEIEESLDELRSARYSSNVFSLGIEGGTFPAVIGFGNAFCSFGFLTAAISAFSFWARCFSNCFLLSTAGLAMAGVKVVILYWQCSCSKKNKWKV